jgi:hypothetical protein
MNEFDEPFFDAELHELLEPLRSVSVPEAVRTANRNAIASALANQRHERCWQRSVAVPVPVALAAGIAVVATTVALVFQAANGQIATTEKARPSAEQKIAPVAAIGRDEQPASGSWTFSRSYIETLQSLAMPQAPADFDTKENRDDS